MERLYTDSKDTAGIHNVSRGSSLELSSQTIMKYVRNGATLHFGPPLSNILNIHIKNRKDGEVERGEITKK